MWFVYVIIAVILLIWISIMVEEDHEEKPTVRQKIRPSDHFDDELYDEDYNPWDVHDFDENRPSGEWVLIPVTSARSNISGTSHRHYAASSFLSGAIDRDISGLPFGVSLVREPNNVHHKNAIKVIGHFTSRNPGVGMHIGYVKRDVADCLAENYSVGMPIAGELKKAGTSDGAIFFGIHVLVPPAKARKPYTLI